jgi:ferredoxin, 2Fe-2S
MPVIHCIEPGGERRTLTVTDGTSLMQAMVSAGIGNIIGECGGAAMCATCHVYVEEPWAADLEPMTDAESDMLEATASPRRPNSRLSCQVRMRPELDGIVIRMPETQA